MKLTNDNIETLRSGTKLKCINTYGNFNLHIHEIYTFIGYIVDRDGYYLKLAEVGGVFFLNRFIIHQQIDNTRCFKYWCKHHVPKS